MVFSGVLLTLFRNHIPKLGIAPRIKHNVSHSVVALGINCRTYANSPALDQRRAELGDVDETRDLFTNGCTNETSLTETRPEKHTAPELEHGNALPEQIDETKELEEHDSPSGVNKPKYLSRGKLLAAHRSRVIPELKEEDLEEMFVRGSGPGGQAINKTSSSVSLIHRPTGIRVQCQATRSREQNRKIARKIMLEKLDQLANPGLSKLQVEQEKIRAKKRQRAKKAKKKAKLKSEEESTATDAESSGLA